MPPRHLYAIFVPVGYSGYLNTELGEFPSMAAAAVAVVVVVVVVATGT